MKLNNESETIEFKRSTSELNEGIISISSMLNKNGYGYLYFGVSNDGNIIGQQIGEDTLRTISQKISNHIKPLPQFSVVKYSKDDKNFIEVKFNGTNKPYSAFGKYYYRHADEDNEMTPYQLTTIIKNENQINTEWNNSLTDLDLSSIDENLLIKKYNEGLALNRFSEQYTNCEDILTKLNLYRNGYLTNSCKYLFSTTKPILLKLAVFATNEKLTFLDMNHFYGNIFECIDKAILYISEHINWKVQINSITRLEIPEVPIEGLREIIVNSFAHANYQHIISSHEINIYPNRITIFNPGQLPYEINLEDFENGVSKSILINPTIANTLYRMGVIEAFGTGIKRTFSICKDSNIKYYYFMNFQGFEFQFERKGQKEFLTEIVSSDLTITQTTILKLLNNTSLTVFELSSKLGLSTRTITKEISKLKDKKYIRRSGSNKNGYWEVLKTS